MAARVTQQFVEVWVTGTPKARVTQQFVEVWDSFTAPVVAASGSDSPPHGVAAVAGVPVGDVVRSAVA